MVAVTVVILKSKKIKSITSSTFLPSICHEMMGLDARIIVFGVFSLVLRFKPAFFHSFFNFIRMFFSSFSFSAIRVISSAYLRFFYISPGNLDSSL